MPVYGTISSEFNNNGLNQFYYDLLKRLTQGANYFKNLIPNLIVSNTKEQLIPPKRNRYLSEIADLIRNYNSEVNSSAEIADLILSLKKSAFLLEESNVKEQLEKKIVELSSKLSDNDFKLLNSFDKKIKKYKDKSFIYEVRGKDIEVQNYSKSLSGLKIPLVSVPKMSSWRDLLIWIKQENFPENFHIPQVFIHLKRKVRILLECLRVKALLREQTIGFII